MTNMKNNHIIKINFEDDIEIHVWDDNDHEGDIGGFQVQASKLHLNLFLFTTPYDSDKLRVLHEILKYCRDNEGEIYPEFIDYALSLFEFYHRKLHPTVNRPGVPLRDDSQPDNPEVAQVIDLRRIIEAMKEKGLVSNISHKTIADAFRIKHETYRRNKDRLEEFPPSQTIIDIVEVLLEQIKDSLLLDKFKKFIVKEKEKH